MANLQRQVRKTRFVVGNTGKFGRLQPFTYSTVFAGETQKEIKAQLNFMSEPINHAQSGATIDVWFYYVPFSLVWSNWQKWIMGDTTDTLSSSDKTSARTLWGLNDSDSGVHTGCIDHALGQAYLQVANHYFRDDENQLSAVPTSPTAVPIVDQSAETSGDIDYLAEDETIDVSSGTLSLKELERKRATLRYERRVEMMDGKYINWLKNQGVNASEQLAEIPEFLGHYRRYVKPSRTVDQSNGFTVQHYGHECKIKMTKRRYFQEAGMVIGVYSVRPKVHLVGGYNTADVMFTTAKQFPQVGQLAEHKMIGNDGSAYGGYENETDATPNTYMSIDAHLWKGRHQAFNVDADYIKSYDPTDDGDAMYPVSAWDSMLVTSQDVHYAVDGVVSHSLVTPLRKLLPA
jgi:hypothetical protein